MPRLAANSFAALHTDGITAFKPNAMASKGLTTHHIYTSSSTPNAIQHTVAKQNWWVLVDLGYYTPTETGGGTIKLFFACENVV